MKFVQIFCDDKMCEHDQDNINSKNIKKKFREISKVKKINLL